ncbi:uncharacterized protein si:dkey-3d4.3 isoform X3 [Pseudoliparis swirei]|uniref:uncharacterized protein si:dkey-3d4.3 isoform X3 n=1 Tax=Pseudoliparis swirei TaxID=2059687 RepID=UPI0024BD6830|nr:uncharacterized protein si:dkey-3d4.3 isoform X3 [Pseudoliparis swirei]
MLNNPVRLIHCMMGIQIQHGYIVHYVIISILLSGDGPVAAMSQSSPCLWTRLPQSSRSPCDRYKHACCSHDGNVYILGGRNSSGLGDFWRYSVVRNDWTELNCTSEAAPEELEEHSMVAHEGFLYVFGGILDSAYTAWRCPLWVFDLAKQTWVNCQRPTRPAQEGPQRCGGGLGHAGVRRLRRHERVLARLLEFGLGHHGLVPAEWPPAGLIRPRPQTQSLRRGQPELHVPVRGLEGSPRAEGLLEVELHQRHVDFPQKQVRALQADGPLGRGLQGQYADLWGRREPELSKELPVEVQLHHAELGAGGHGPGLQPPRQDPPLLCRARSQLQVQQQQQQLQLRNPTGPSGRETEALQEQVLPRPAHVPGLRGRHRAGDLQPG